MTQVHPIDFKDWDDQVVKKGADYEMLHKEMLDASNDPKNNQNVEVWWRLAQVTFLSSLDSLADGIIRPQTWLAYDYADKAVRVDQRNFQANLWLAITAGKLTVIELDLKKTVQMIGLFLKHLNICIKMKPDHYMVLFLDGQMQLSLFRMSAEEKAFLLRSHRNLPFPNNLANAETKLRKSIEINPNCIESYNALGILLIKCENAKEAYKVLEKGITIERMNKSDEAIARQMQELISLKK